VVILVHGRGHLGADSAELRREWKRDLDSALATVGLPRLVDEDVRLAWYSDALDPSFRAACDNASDPDSLGVQSLFHGVISAIADAMPKNEAAEARALVADALYVMDPTTRCAAQRRVGTAIEGALAEKRPVVVVAYSLGSVVTYGYLNARKVDTTRHEDLRLITLGSPLGNTELRMLLGGSEALRVPPGVTAWENVYDANDLFAAPLESKMPARIVRDRVMRAADIAEAHHVRRYLRDRETGAAIGRALCAQIGGVLSEPCRQLLRSETT
jgi:hypothetical protein